jgi:hypothetical protein
MFAVTDEVTIATREEEAAGVGTVEQRSRTPIRPTSSSNMHLRSQSGATSSSKAVAYVEVGQSSIGPQTPWIKFDGGLMVIWVSHGFGAWVVVVVVVVVVAVEVVVGGVVKGVVAVVGAAVGAIVVEGAVVAGVVVVVPGGKTVGGITVVVACCC